MADEQNTLARSYNFKIITYLLLGYADREIGARRLSTSLISDSSSELT